jgi:hypothetical protein
MAMSVLLDPTLETRVAQESRRLGVSKSEFVKDALERVLGLKNPADLLNVVRSRKAMGNPQASRNVSARMKAKLRAPATRQSLYFAVAGELAIKSCRL